MLQVMASGQGDVCLVAVDSRNTCSIDWRSASRFFLHSAYRDFDVVGTVLLVPVVFFIVPYRIDQVEVGLRRSIGGWHAPIANFFASPTPVHVFLQSLVTDKTINGVATAWLFPGFLPVALALVAILVGSAALIRSLTRPAPIRANAGKSQPGALRYKPAIKTLLVAMAACVLLTAARPIFGAGSGLTMQRFSSARVVQSGYLTVPQAGQYSFSIDSDTGPARLLIGSLLIIDHQGPETLNVGSASLPRGSHRLLLEYLQPNEQPAPTWSWAREGVDRRLEEVPAWALSRRPTSGPAVLAVRAADVLRLLFAIAVGLAATWCLSIWWITRRRAWIAWGAPYRRNPTPLYWPDSSGRRNTSSLV